MKTVEEFCTYCEETGNIPKTQKRKSSQKSFQVVKSLFQEGENAKIAFNGFLNMKSVTKSDGIFSFVVTESRIIGAYSALSSKNTKIVKLEKIESVSFSENYPYMGFSTFSFNTLSEAFTISMDKKSAKKINAELQQII